MRTRTAIVRAVARIAARVQDGVSARRLASIGEKPLANQDLLAHRATGPLVVLAHTIKAW